MGRQYGYEQLNEAYRMGAIYATRKARQLIEGVLDGDGDNDLSDVRLVLMANQRRLRAANISGSRKSETA